MFAMTLLGVVTHIPTGYKVVIGILVVVATIAMIIIGRTDLYRWYNSGFRLKRALSEEENLANTEVGPDVIEARGHNTLSAGQTIKLFLAAFFLVSSVYMAGDILGIPSWLKWYEEEVVAQAGNFLADPAAPVIPITEAPIENGAFKISDALMQQVTWQGDGKSLRMHKLTNAYWALLLTDGSTVAIDVNQLHTIEDPKDKGFLIYSPVPDGAKLFLSKKPGQTAKASGSYDLPPKK